MHVFSLAQCVGYVAFVFGIAAFLQKDDRRLKIFIGIECLVYATHFWLLGSMPSAFSALVSFVRSMLSLKTRSRIVVAVIICVNIVFGIFYVKNWVGWLPIASSCFATVAFFMMQGIAMRLVLLVCTLLWLANNILCGSIGGTLLETSIAIANGSTIARLLAEARSTAKGEGIWALLRKAS